MILIPTKTSRQQWEHKLRTSLMFYDLYRPYRHNVGPLPEAVRHYNVQMDSDYLAALANVCNRHRYDPRLLPVPLDLAATTCAIMPRVNMREAP